MLDLYWMYVLGWAQPDALKGLVRAWHMRANAFYTPILETHKDNISYCLNLGSGSELLKACSASSALPAIRDWSNISLCVKSCLCSLSHSLGLSKGGGRRKVPQQAVSLFPKTWCEAFSSLLSVTKVVILQSRHPVNGFLSMVSLLLSSPQALLVGM